MAYNKVIKKDGTVMLDLTNTTVSEETLAKNITAVDKYGNKIIGTLTDSPLPIEVSTEEEMTELLTSGEVSSIYKYIGTTGTYENNALYEITEESDPLQGTWVFNDTLTFPERNFQVDIAFTSNNTSFSRFWMGGSSTGSMTKNKIIYGLDGTNFVYESGWNDENYKIIEITSTYDELVSLNDETKASTFLSWLQANATKQSSRTFEKLVIQIGTLNITTNGEYDVTEYANANIDIINTLQYVMDNNGDTPSCRYLFREWQGTDPTSSLTGVDTSKVTDMESMFMYCFNLTTIPLLDTSNVTNMSRMFYRCTNLTTIPQLDTSNVTNMYYMFEGCTNLTTIPLLDTSNVTNMGYMFNKCTNLTTIPLLDTSNVTDMRWIFTGCSNLTSIPLLDTSKVTNMDYMFEGCTNLTTISELDTTNITDMGYMFRNCTSLTTIPQLDTRNVTDMGGMFYGCTNLTTIPLLDTSNVTNMGYMFEDCTSLTTIPLLDTSNVTRMTGMFQGCTNLTTIPQLNTSNVTNMSNMFAYCDNLTTVPPLDTSNVTNMTNMFYGCTNLKSILMTNMKVDFDISSSTQFETDDLVTILNNLATVSSTTTLTMGETNLAKLSDEQKQIAIDKGWTLA